MNCSLYYFTESIKCFLDISTLKQPNEINLDITIIQQVQGLKFFFIN